MYDKSVPKISQNGKLCNNVSFIFECFYDQQETFLDRLLRNCVTHGMKQQHFTLNIT